jgi:hypothetical protein
MDSVREFHPEKISRRAEVTIWVLAVFSLAALTTLRFRVADVSPWYTVFVGLMYLSAASTTLGNWMDRKTVLILRSDGLDFTNGLRDVSFNWDDIQEVQVFPSRWGTQAHIVGTLAHFSFRTKSELTHKGEIRAKMGFAQGEYIIEQILKNGGLQENDQTGKGRYYAHP